MAFWRLRGILPMLAATLFLSSVENNPVVARSKSMAIKTMLPAFPSSSLSTSLRSLWLGTRAQSQVLVAGHWCLTAWKRRKRRPPENALFVSIVHFLAVSSFTEKTMRPLRAIGRISYGVYLWHMMVLHALKPHLSAPDSMNTFGFASQSLPWQAFASQNCRGSPWKGHYCLGAASFRAASCA